MRYSDFCIKLFDDDDNGDDDDGDCDDLGAGQTYIIYTKCKQQPDESKKKRLCLVYNSCVINAQIQITIK